MPIADLGGHRLSWAAGGAGDPALLIHCTLGRAGAWRGVAAHLPAWVAPDLPGHGGSADVPAGRDLLEVCAASVGALRDRARAADIVGHSYGAVVALRIAASAPARVRTLTLIEPVLFAAAEGTPEHAAYLATHAAVARALEEGRAAEAAAVFTAEWGDGRPWATLSESARGYMTERIGLVPRQAPGIVDDRSGLLSPGVLEGIAAPVLLVEGATSPPVVGAILDALEARLPRVGRAVIEGAGHMAPITHADAVGARIAAHLRDA